MENVKIQNKINKKIYNGIIENHEQNEGDPMFGSNSKDEYIIRLDNNKTIAIDTLNILSLYKFID